MRIPVNSCEGCNKDAPLNSNGFHAMGDGLHIRCAFLTAELSGYNPPLTFLGVYRNKRAAVRQANKHIAGLLWIGQSPVNMWAVVK
jgi:hypothetical protein